MHRRALFFALIGALTSAAPVLTFSSAAAADPATVVASGLINPKGFTWGLDGVLYVALSDRGGAPAGPKVEPIPATPVPAAAGAKPTVPGIGTAHAGAQTGSVVKIVAG